MSALTLSARLDRTDSSTPWGFRLHGGTDFRAPLTIQRVTPGSLAAKCGLQVGDAILKIGNAPTDSLPHKSAQQQIVNCGNSLDLTLQRGGGILQSAPASAPQSYAPEPAPVYNPAPSGYAPPSAGYANYNTAPKPFTPGGGGGVPMAVNKQYNSPLNMYSVNNVMDSLSGQTQALNMGASNGSAPIPPWASGGGGPAAAAPRAAPTHSPAAAPAPAHAPQRPGAGGAASWAPQVPTGPRKMKLGRIGDAKSMSAHSGAGRVPMCHSCGVAIRGPFISALEKSFCPNHFSCGNPSCGAELINIGFVEEAGKLYCEKDYEQYLAPRCGKCGNAIVGEVVNAMKDTFHMNCFTCVGCRVAIGTGSFHIEEGKVYCQKDWAQLFQTKCFGCQFPIEPGDRWVEALNENWHSECFNCSTCQCNLEGQPFFAKQGKPYCKKHAMSPRF